MIRQFERKDLGAVMDIWLRTTIDANPFIDKMYFIANYQNFQEDHLLRSQSHVYEIDGKIVGFVSIKQDMIITTINVDTPYRLSGIGEALINVLANKFQQISVKCYLENTDGLAFFNKLGFEAVGSEKETETEKELVILTLEGQRDSKRN